MAKKTKKRKSGESIKGLIGWAGKKGFRGCVTVLRGKKGIRTPEKLCGWLKGQAKSTGVLSRAHGGGKKRK